MDHNNLTSLGYVPTLEIKDAERNRDFWLDLPRLREETRQILRGADILIVPEGDDYEGQGAYFPEDATDFYQFLQAQEVAVEIAADEEDFQELARHNLLYVLGEFVLTSVVVPTFIALVVEYLKGRVLNPETNAMKIAMIYQKSDGSAKRLQYEGPVSTFETQIQSLLAEFIEDSLPDSSSPALPPAPDENPTD